MSGSGTAERPMEFIGTLPEFSPFPNASSLKLLVFLYNVIVIFLLNSTRFSYSLQEVRYMVKLRIQYFQ